MRTILRLALAAFVLLWFQACKPTLSPTQIPEEDYFATVTLNCVVQYEFSMGNWQTLDVTPAPIVKVKRSFDGREYSFAAKNGKLTKKFGLGDVESDTLTLTVEYESELTGHLKGTKTVTIKADKESDLVEIRCYKI